MKFAMTLTALAIFLSALLLGFLLGRLTERELWQRQQPPTEYDDRRQP